MQQLGRDARRDRDYMPRRHCEERSDEAIQSYFAALDCFASLAMTVRGNPVKPKREDKPVQKPVHLLCKSGQIAVNKIGYIPVYIAVNNL
jgi:hypothetical protein